MTRRFESIRLEPFAWSSSHFNSIQKNCEILWPIGDEIVFDWLRLSRSWFEFKNTKSWMFYLFFLTTRRLKDGGSTGVENQSQRIVSVVFFFLRAKVIVFNLINRPINKSICENFIIALFVLFFRKYFVLRVPKTIVFFLSAFCLVADLRGRGKSKVVRRRDNTRRR